MRISYITKDSINNLVLPSRAVGNYWITDKSDNDNSKNIINVKALDGKWEMTSNVETNIIYNAKYVKNVFLDMNTFYSLKEKNRDDLTFIYTSEVYDSSYKVYEVTSDTRLKIGRATDCNIIYNNYNVKEVNNELSYQGNNWVINDLGSQFGTYVNNKRVGSKLLKNGDIIFIMGLKIIVLGRKLIINNPKGSVRINTNYLVERPIENKEQIKVEDYDASLVHLYKPEDYFIRSPRFKAGIMITKMKINAPPDLPAEETRPALLTIGPMMTMGLMSFGTVFNVMGRLGRGARMSEMIPQLLMASTMLIGSLIWPIIARRYEKKERIRIKKERTAKYKQYIAYKEKQILLIAAAQRDTLLDNNVSLGECASIIKTKHRRLWERDITHNDFLKLRLGLGNSTLKIELEAPTSDFDVDDSELQVYMTNMINKVKMLYDVPITENFVAKNVVAIEGKKNQSREFINNLILQMATFHSFQDLKLVIFTNEDNKEYWDYTKSLPHCWNNFHNQRYFASTSDDMKDLSFLIEQDLKKRSTNPENGEQIKLSGDDLANSHRRRKPYYVIITDNYEVARNLQIIKDISESSINWGFSLFIMGENLNHAPANTKSFISLGEKSSSIFESNLMASNQKTFVQDKADYNIDELSTKLANIPIQYDAEGEFSLPDMVSFLETYKAGMIDQLNPVARWKNNNPVNNLAVPVGIGTSGEVFKLDLHEKYHGPHGLIAGMTGSGKSEFIITYILGLSINFSPDEVQFVLIDYKGGGLAGAFENRETGVRLPHLIGTITNLDVTEINRSLLSIQSELKRRQSEFNKARDKLNESTMDIYKYQKYYREGLLDTPISHLFLISDEFAELKAQQPDFMDQLISTARIGRSLGVHLILATQKPGGVVNDQIWSNSRFRVCLKVQDAADSKEMIRRPDAASLKQAGRFYLQVGYDEFFALGQSAWCGAPYVPSEKVVKQVDDSLAFIDEAGNVIKSINNEVIKERESHGEELPNILKYIRQVAQLEGYKEQRLWLERIPGEIFISELKKKYNYKSPLRQIDPVIGEYDLPAFQKQEILTLNLSEEGNTYVVGLTGKEMFFRSLTYSIAESYTPDEANVYILDFDTESLNMYRGNPVVGDVITTLENEKVDNFFKMIDEIKETRRRILKDYNGDYNFYLEHGDKPMPLIVVMITSIETFLETYPVYDDILVSFTRDSVKYGIVFVVGATSENGMRMNMRRNFTKKLALEMNTSDDYRSFLGTRSKLIPSRGVARGLLMVGDGTYEFQTAKFCKDEEINLKVKELADNLSAKYETRARKVPTLPDIVKLEDVKDNISSIKEFALGLYTDSLEPALYNFSDRLFNIIMSEFNENMLDLVQTLLGALEAVPNISMQFWDMSLLYKDEIKKDYYVNTGFLNVIEQLIPYVENQKKKLESNNMNYDVLKDEPSILIFASDFGSFYAGLDKETKGTVNNLLNMAKLTKTLNFVLIDSISNLKKFKYDDWYSLFTDQSEGIFVGSNVLNAGYKFSYEPRFLRDNLRNDYGYIIDKGVPNKVKFISSKKDEDYER